MTWFSAMLRFTITVGSALPHQGSRSVVLIRADDFDDARAAARRLGKGMEETYRNIDGELVTWRFQAVETVDELGEQLESGREVYSEPISLDQVDRWADDGSPPGSTGV